MRLDGLHAVADQAALYVRLRQESLDRYLDAELGSHRADFDAATRAVTFSSTRGTICSAAIVAARIEPTSIVWGWAEPDGDPHGAAIALRDTGGRFGLTELVHPRLDLDDLGDGDGPARLAETTAVVGATAVAGIGISPYVCVELATAGQAVLLLEDLDLPEPSFADFAGAASRLLPDLPVIDHRVAVHGMAARRGWHIAWQSRDDHGRSPTCAVTDGSSVAHIDFDPRGRPTGVRLDAGR